MRLKFDLKKKLTQEDLKTWRNFTASKEPIDDKDKNLYKKDYYFRKIRKIDLHGCSLDEANNKIEQLINRSYEENVKKIIVVTGKGLRSKNNKNPYLSRNLSILKYSVPKFITTNENIKNKIKNISEATMQDGGEGAFYIFLKKFKE